jgi:hypothetical protein
MSVSPTYLQDALDSESGFIVVTMGKFPHLFKDFSDKLFVVEELLLSKKVVFSMDDAPVHRLQEYRDYLDNLEKAKEYIKKLIWKAKIAKSLKEIFRGCYIGVTMF